MYKVFIDGSAGTTGLKIFDRLANRKDVSLITLAEAVRKDVNARKDAINKADVCFLCLPDEASKESVSLLENKNTVIIDTSTAHRTDDRFAYGFAELKGFRQKIQSSKLIANPGCHASGVIALIKPLIDANVLDKNIKFSATSLTGYSGGGKKMIKDYEAEDINVSLTSPRLYGLSQQHKHLPEISKVCGLENAPVFMPIVANFYSGMEVTIPLFMSDLKCSLSDVKEIYKQAYNSKIVYYKEIDEAGFLPANLLSNRDDMQISVYGNDERITLISRFDNLGKGASGAAVQNMNIALGLDESYGLNLGE